MHRLQRVTVINHTLSILDVMMLFASRVFDIHQCCVIFVYGFVSCQ
jgi:hypothetical protein